MRKFESFSSISPESLSERTRIWEQVCATIRGLKRFKYDLEKQKEFAEGSKEEKDLLTKFPDSDVKRIIEISGDLGDQIRENPEALEQSFKQNLGSI